MLAQTRQAVVLANDPAAEPIPEPRVRSQKQDEPVAAAEPFRRVLRRLLLRDVQVRRGGGGGCLR